MRCNDVRAILSHTEPGDRERFDEVERHLATCAGCRGFRDFLRQVEEGIRSGSDLVLPAPTLARRIRAAIAREDAARAAAAQAAEAAENPSRPDDAAAATEGRRKMPHVLAVDDEPNIVRLIQVNLERQGYQVETAGTGVQALTKIRARRPDLVVSDVMMPEMGGFELLANIRRDPALMDLPVIMLTAKVQDRDVMQGYQTGADMYLTKPFNPHELVQFVGRILAAQGDEGDAYRIS
jgi:two-component system alkaline phosphatase synthesis response regulator PhoP/two-component system response regulator VicR